MKLFILLLIFSVFASVACNFRNERIINAQYVIRPINYGPLKNTPVPHHGIKVMTEQGNSYLIHNTPRTGVVATNAPMSSQWETTHNIPINNHKTVGETMKAANGIGTGPLSYVTSGTCIGASVKAEEYLQK